MLTVGLKDVKFRGYHGVYAAEQVTGGEFIINLSVSYDPASKVVSRLEETLNYEAIFNIVQARMERPAPLLEQVVMEITQQLFAYFGQIEKVEISLEKVQPPIEKLNGRVFVQYAVTRAAFLQKG